MPSGCLIPCSAPQALVRPAFESQLALLRELALTVFKQQLAMGGGGSPRSPGRGAATFVERAQRCAAGWGWCWRLGLAWIFVLGASLLCVPAYSV